MTRETLHPLLRRLTFLFALSLASVLPGLAAGQALDELRYSDSGNDAVLQVKFNVRVQFQRYAPQVASDLFEVYFVLVGGDESLTHPVEESITTPQLPGKPQATVIYPVQPAEPVKKIVIRLDRVATFKVRPGPNNQTIEIVMPGLAQKAAVVPVPVLDRNRFAIELERVPLAQKDNLRPIPSRFDRYTVFGTRQKESGADLYEVDLGFFETREAAEAVRRDALGDFPQASVFDVGQRKEETLRSAPIPAPGEPVVTAPAPVPTPPAVVAAPAPAAKAQEPAAAVPPSLPSPAPAVTAVIPSPAPAAATAASGVVGAASSAAAATAATASTSSAPSTAPSAAPPAAPSTASSTAPAVPPSAAAPAAPGAPGEFAPTPAGPRAEGVVPQGPGAGAVAMATAAQTDELEKSAAELMRKSREALASGKNDDAVNLLNQLLLLPPNHFSQDAQELIGLARERAGEPALARKEYELYLQLFPTGDGATRVRQRLASIAPPEQATTIAAKPKEKREPTYSYGGSLSQSYYGGDAATQTVFVNVPTLANQQSISNTTQSALVSSIDLNGRYRTENNDTRIVFRDTSQNSFLTGSPSINRLDAAYVDYRSEEYRAGVRVGRQAGVTGGLVGRFDGAAFSYDFQNKMRLNVVAGDPVDKIVGSTQRFEGISLDAQGLAEHWGAGGFLINQTADGVTDRRAVGGEVRYFSQNKSLYTLFDYDLNFHALNAVTVQGNYQLKDQTNFSLIADDRKAPTLATSNGLIQFGCNTFAQAYGVNQCTQPGTFTLSDIKSAAKATTADAKQFAIDVSRPFGQHWQASADFRLTNIGKLPTVTVNGITFPGTNEGTGNVYSESIQTTGSNLYSKRDISVFSYTHLAGPIYRGDQFTISNLNGLMGNRLSIEPNLSFYRQRDLSGGTAGQKLSRISPGLHASYKLLRRLSVDASVMAEHTTSDGPTQNNTTRDTFYYVGYRLDLNP